MNLSFSLFDQEHSGLAWQFRVSPSSCDNPGHYEEYIRFVALSDKRSGMGVTHVLIDACAGRIAGFVALRLSSLFYTGDDGKKRGSPALEIAELAVDADYEKNGVGSALIDFAAYTADNIRGHMAGIKYLLACADPAAVGFYEKKGFSRVSDLFEMPRDGSNNNCTPMYIQFPET